ncbi:MAG: SGNH/GDSL hydrolase family protein [Chloroflexi bacterium]|nr:SGNH/GDSL hydrolase family protein [Chloroflexota bacterium]
MKLQPHSRLLFIGDSITDCGRRFPVGEGAFDQALGDGFVSLVDAALTAVYPDYAIHTINMGISGNTIRDLKARWQTDVLDLQPDWLVIKIGINDVWQHLSQTFWSGQNISLAEYAQTLDQLVLQTRSRLRGLIVMTPYFLDLDHQEPMRVMMDRFGAAAKEVAARHQALLADTQAAFDVALQSMDPMQLAMDHVHPNLVGHMILARAFLREIKFAWER